MKLLRKKVREAITLVMAAAAGAVAEGRYPNMQVALHEMAANQRTATRLGVDIHDLLKEAGR